MRNIFMMPKLASMVPITQSKTKIGQFMREHFPKMSRHIDNRRIMNAHQLYLDLHDRPGNCCGKIRHNSIFGNLLENSVFSQFL